MLRFQVLSVSILAPVLDQAKADLTVIASSDVRLMTRNKRGTSVPLFLPINLRSSKITRTIESVKFVKILLLSIHEKALSLLDKNVS